MKLSKCLSMIKCVKFSVFIYPEGHVKEKRGIYEEPVSIMEIERNENGELPYIEFAKSRVKEIIPYRDGAAIVAEIKWNKQKSMYHDTTIDKSKVKKELDKESYYEAFSLAIIKGF